ncbi:FtsK/SpoIIIE domain-containing protein [Actinomycetospora flava]|uniref:FtsK/SpoIIIE domain-containing protein n=1 Tax=Actinomycetospora flava TaxID=3129232 RepID=A0ABU8MI27_9PSEU
MRTLTPRWRERRAFSEHYERRLRVDGYANTWRDACDWAGLAQHIRIPAGQTIVTPELVDVAGYDPTVITVRLLPGMLVADLAEQALRLANALGGVRLSVAPMGTEYARLLLHQTDPLADPFVVQADEVDGLLGVGEDGRDIAVPWARRVHTLVQGSTGGGKSTLVYGQLSALAGRRDVIVSGIDPSGLVFRPWPAHPDRLSGLADELAPHIELLRRLCADMDDRLGLLPLGVDNLTPTSEVPLRVVLLEEFSGFLRTVDADRKVATVVRPLLGRLFSEGRKVGIRCIAVLPRADAAILGAGIRDQCGLRVSYAVEPEGFRMAHPTATAGIAPEDHVTAPPGIAIVTIPGAGTFRIRTGDLGYAEYCRRVAAASLGLAA